MGQREKMDPVKPARVFAQVEPVFAFYECRELAVLADVQRVQAIINDSLRRAHFAVGCNVTPVLYPKFGTLILRCNLYGTAEQTIQLVRSLMTLFAPKYAFEVPDVDSCPPADPHRAFAQQLANHPGFAALRDVGLTKHTAA